MMHGHEKSDLVIVAMKPANKAKEAHCGGVCGGERAELVERRAGAKGNTHQQSTYWTQSQARVTQALERIRQLSPSYTRGGSRMRESRTYGSVRGACDETHVPTATGLATYETSARENFCIWPLGAAALVPCQRLHRAQAYPSRPVRILVGFAAGGSSDIHARLLGQWLSERLLAWSQSFRPIIAKSS